VFHNTTPDLQDQDSVLDRFFWSQTGLVLRPMVSDHITGPKLYTSRVIVYLIVDLTTATSEVRYLNERRQYFVASLYVSFFCKELFAINDFELLTSCDLQILGQGQSKSNNVRCGLCQTSNVFYFCSI